MALPNYTDIETAKLYNSLHDKTIRIPKKMLRILNKHDIPLTDKEEIADILVNLLHKNRVQTTLNDIKITSRNSNWSDRKGKTTTAITDGITGERGQLDDELSEYANITNTPIATRKSIKKHYKKYRPNYATKSSKSSKSSNSKGKTKKNKRKKRKSIRKK